MNVNELRRNVWKGINRKVKALNDLDCVKKAWFFDKHLYVMLPRDAKAYSEFRLSVSEPFVIQNFIGKYMIYISAFEDYDWLYLESEYKLQHETKPLQECFDKRIKELVVWDMANAVADKRFDDVEQAYRRRVKHGRFTADDERMIADMADVYDRGLFAEEGTVGYCYPEDRGGNGLKLKGFELDA